MSIDAESISPVEFEGLLRQKLPEILIEHGEFRYEIMGIMADVFASKDDFKQVLEEIRKLREDSNQRFEEMNLTMDRRFEEMNLTMNQRFEEMYRNQREVRLEVSALGGRVGYGLENIIMKTVEQFSGQSFKTIKRLGAERSGRRVVRSARGCGV